MKRFPIIFCLIMLSLALDSCKNSKDKPKGEEPAIEQQQQPIVEVDTMVLRKQTFQKQLLCNGRLEAVNKAELQCSKPGEILQSVNVVNGQHVAKGALLCVADTRARHAELDKARHDLEKARVELQDKLISLGYDGDVTKAPADVLHRAEIVSGYYTAKYQLQEARNNLAECQLRAPFSGRIANLEARAHQPGNKFATLIDDAFFEVDFKILEAELALVRRGQAVKVSPYVNDKAVFGGVVTEINPTVDDKGMVSVTARVHNSSGRLMDGMNVKVVVENAVQGMFVVPKEAVVERDGYNVIFTYNKETHRAVWTYVDILYSNLGSYAITGCARKDTEIHQGDIVITSGNLNLADDTEVTIRKQ